MNYPMQSYGLGGLNTVQNMSDQNMMETLMANGGQRFALGGLSSLGGDKSNVSTFTFDPITGQYTQIDGATAASSNVPTYTYDPVTQKYTLVTDKQSSGAAILRQLGREGERDGGSAGDSDVGGNKNTQVESKEAQAARSQTLNDYATQASKSGLMGMALSGINSLMGAIGEARGQAAVGSYGGGSFAEQNALNAAMSSPSTGVGNPGEQGEGPGNQSGNESTGGLGSGDGGMGSGGGRSAGDARGGFYKNGKFDQRPKGMAYGGLSALAQGGITGSGNLDLSIPIDIGGGSMGGAGGVSGGSYPFTSIGGQGSSPQQTFGSSNNPQPFIGSNNARSMMPQQGVTFLPDPTLDPKIRQFPTDMESVRQSMMNTRGLPPNVMFAGGGIANLGDYSDGGRLLRGPGDGVSDSIPATIANKQPARLADGEFVVPARIVSELGNGSTEAGARKLYQMLARVQNARKKSIGQGRVAVNSRAEKLLPA